MAPITERSERSLDLDATVYTDDGHAYDKVLAKHRAHETVKHGKDEWVRGDIHTNGIESAWGLFKRSVIGSYHQLSAKHLAAYLDEFEFRFNNRNNPYIFRDTLARIMRTDPLQYRELVA